MEGLEAAAPEFGCAAVSGVEALFVLVQPTVINPNTSRTTRLCFIDKAPSALLQKFDVKKKRGDGVGPDELPFFCIC
jgi:hypothetical protein